MSHYHVLKGDQDGRNYTIVFHITVPNENNVVGTVNLRTALTEDPAHTSASVVPHIGSTETTALADGSLYEHVETYGTHENHGTAADRNVLDNRYTALSTAIPNRLRKIYAYWRFDRNVP